MACNVPEDAAQCNKGASDSAFDQPNYPNNMAGTPTPFDPSKQLGGAGGGVVGNVNFTALNAEIAAAAASIDNPLLLPTQHRTLQ